MALLLPLIININMVCDDDSHGIVVDAESGEPLAGATVVANQKKGVLTDNDGHFLISGLKRGTYTLTIRYLAYKTLTLGGVKTVSEGDTTMLRFCLESDDQMLGEAKVVESKRQNTANAMILEARRSEMIVNNISAQEIKRAQDGNAGEVIRRIPGISLIKDKFVMVRGLSQRYNNVWINGGAVPSTEADSRAFSFDVIPAGQIDHLQVVKSPSPEYPADFCGGFIQIFTKDIPATNGWAVSVGGNWNDQTHFSDFQTSKGSRTDFLGFDNGLRRLQGGMGGTMTLLPGTQNGIGLTENGFNNDWHIRTRTPVGDLKLHADWNHRMALSRGKVGMTASLNYTHEYRAYEGMTNNLFGVYDVANDRSNYLRRSMDNQYNENTRVGALFNMAFLTNSGQHKVELKNILNLLSTDRYTERTGVNAQSDNEVGAEYLFQSRLTYNGQLCGKHSYAGGDGTVEWAGGYSFANRLLPDRRRYTVDDALERGTMMLTAGNEISREFTKLSEHIASVGVSDAHTFQLPRISPVLKTGIYGERRSRAYNTREFIYNWPLSSNTLPDDFRKWNMPDLLSDESCLGAGALHLLEQQNMRNDYGGRNWLGAAYAALSIPAGRWNIHGGVRYEYNVMTLITNTRDYEVSPMERDYTTSDFFPTLSTTFRIDRRQQLRLSYGRSANRPEFREVSPSVFYDFALASHVQGNVDLLTCHIDNLDLRYEVYPSSGEQITVAAFYKHFDSPIEWTYTVAGGTGLIYSYENAEQADNYGIELDIRKDLSFIGLKDFSLSFNGALIKSRVEFAEGSRFKNRPMQGQSPYLVNTGLFYQNDRLQLSAALLYNRIGKRIIGVGRSEGSSGSEDNARVPDSYEMPRDVLDLTFSKRWGEHFELKASVRDVLAEKVRYRQFDTVTLHGGQTKEITQTTREYKPGRNFNVTMVLKF